MPPKPSKPSRSSSVTKKTSAPTTTQVPPTTTSSSSSRSSNISAKQPHQNPHGPSRTTVSTKTASSKPSVNKQQDHNDDHYEETVNDDILCIALFGGSGVGKSTVAGILADLGGVVLSCDECGNQVLHSEHPCGAYKKLVERFTGDAIVGPKHDVIDRDKLRSLIATDREAHAYVNEVTHAAINEVLKAKRFRVKQALTKEKASAKSKNVDESFPGKSFIVIDGEGVDLTWSKPTEVWVIDAMTEQRIERLVDRTGLSRDDATVYVELDKEAGDAENRAQVLASLGFTVRTVPNRTSIDALRSNIEDLVGQLKGLAREGIHPASMTSRIQSLTEELEREGRSSWRSSRDYKNIAAPTHLDGNLAAVHHCVGLIAARDRFVRRESRQAAPQFRILPSSSSSSSPASSFPDDFPLRDVMCRVCGFLPISDLPQLAATCRSFTVAVSDDAIWKDFVARISGSPARVENVHSHRWIATADDALKHIKADNATWASLMFYQQEMRLKWSKFAMMLGMRMNEIQSDFLTRISPQDHHRLPMSRIPEHDECLVAATNDFRSKISSSMSSAGEEKEEKDDISVWPKMEWVSLSDLDDPQFRHYCTRLFVKQGFNEIAFELVRRFVVPRVNISPRMNFSNCFFDALYLPSHAGLRANDPERRNASTPQLEDHYYRLPATLEGPNPAAAAAVVYRVLPGFRADGGTLLEIIFLTVHKNYRHLSIGKLIVETLLEKIAARFRCCMMYVETGPEESERFWESNGFRKLPLSGGSSENWTEASSSSVQGAVDLYDRVFFDNYCLRFRDTQIHYKELPKE